MNIIQSIRASSLIECSFWGIKPFRVQLCPAHIWPRWVLQQQAKGLGWEPMGLRRKTAFSYHHVGRNFYSLSYNQFHCAIVLAEHCWPILVEACWDWERGKKGRTCAVHPAVCQVSNFEMSCSMELILGRSEAFGAFGIGQTLGGRSPKLALIPMKIHRQGWGSDTLSFI